MKMLLQSNKDHNPEKDMKIYILQTGLKTEAEREFHEDRWICRLQTMEPSGINKEPRHVRLFLKINVMIRWRQS